MRHAARWGLFVVLAAVAVGCGDNRTGGEVPGEAPRPVPKPPEPIPDEIEREALAMARDFLDQGGDVNETLAESHLLGEPAMDVNRLHVAAERGWLSVVRYLVEHGANVEAVAPSKSHYNDLTPLDVARHAGHPHVVAFLEQLGTTKSPGPREVARAFVEASRKGDLEAARALCTRRATESILPSESGDGHQSAIRDFDVRTVQVTGEQAVARVWALNEALPEGETEFTLVLTLRRAEGAWRVDDLALEPHWEPEDLGPEVSR